MRALGTMLGVVLIVVAAAFAVAEEPAAPQPTAEHRALEAWTGSWSGKGEMKPGPFGPGGPMSWSEDCSWFEGGGFHVVCRTQGTSPMGPMKGLGIVGYNAEKKVYTHYGVDSTGWSGYSEGTRTGDTWTFQSKEMMGGMTYHSRFNMTMTSPTTMTFNWEMSEDGSKWTVMMDGTTSKK
jgi:hypothetical protein